MLIFEILKMIMLVRGCPAFFKFSSHLQWARDENLVEKCKDHTWAIPDFSLALRVTEDVHKVVVAAE